jgi:hypothetical protein
VAKNSREVSNLAIECHWILSITVQKRLSNMQNQYDGDDLDVPVIPSRGRSRSHSMHEKFSPDLAAEIAAIASPSHINSAIPIAGDASTLSADLARPGAGKNQLSKKTIAMLTNLTAASVPPELEQSHDLVLSEEELAEKELAAEDRLSRATEHTSGGLITSTQSAGQSIAASAGAKSTSGSGGVGCRAKILRGGEGEHDVLVKLLLLGDGGVGAFYYLQFNSLMCCMFFSSFSCHVPCRQDVFNVALQ